MCDSFLADRVVGRRVSHPAIRDHPSFGKQGVPGCWEDVASHLVISGQPSFGKLNKAYRLPKIARDASRGKAECIVEQIYMCCCFSETDLDRNGGVFGGRGDQVNVYVKVPRCWSD